MEQNTECYPCCYAYNNTTTEFLKKWKLGLVMEKITRKKRESERKKRQSWAGFHKMHPLK